MVVRLGASPIGFVMTIVARFPQAPLVRIVRFVTIETASGCIAKLYIRCVAAVAWHGLMGVPQVEIRRGVRERLAVKQDDVSVPPLVIGMTMGAFLFHCIRLTPVNPPDRLPVARCIFMAIQAKLGL